MTVSQLSQAPLAKEGLAKAAAGPRDQAKLPSPSTQTRWACLRCSDCLGSESAVGRRQRRRLVSAPLLPSHRPCRRWCSPRAEQFKRPRVGP